MLYLSDSILSFFLVLMKIKWKMCQSFQMKEAEASQRGSGAFVNLSCLQF